MNRIFCKLCDSDVLARGRHFKDIHKITAKEYYDTHIKQLNDDICDRDNCYCKTRFDGILKGYKKYCCTGCSRLGKARDQKTKTKCSLSRIKWLKTEDGINHNKNLSINRRGLDNPVHKQSKETRERMSQNNSLKMRQKILNNEFTPCVTNSWCKSRTLVNNIPFRSRWEAAFYILNETEHLFYEKLRISYILNNKERVYIVDFIDTFNKIVYEIKPDVCLDTDINNAKIKALEEWSKNNSYTYQIIGNSYFKNNAKKINFSLYRPEIYKSMKQFLLNENP